MTAEEIAAAREQIIEDELSSDALSSVSVDGMSMSIDRDAYKRRLTILDELTVRDNSQPHFGLRFSKLIPPGGGG